MPRNSSGTYSLPAGNPVVTGTVISSTWANTTLSDIGTALTGSLARNGDGGMTGVLKLADGAIGAPGLAWGNETTSGWYRSAAGDFRYAIGGTDVAGITSGGISARALVPTASTVPANGMYLSAANTVAIASNTTLRWSVNSTGNHSVAVPSSGTSIAIDRTGLATGYGIVISGFGTGYSGINYSNTGGNYYVVADGSAGGFWSGSPAYALAIGSGSARDISFGTNNTERVRIGSAGNVTINAPSSGTTLTLTVIAGQNSFVLTDATRTLIAGTDSGLGTTFIGTSTAHGFDIYSKNVRLIRLSDGMLIGAATGGDKGAGTLNTAGQPYYNNEELGYRSLYNRGVSGSDTFSASDAGRLVQYTGSGGHTITGYAAANGVIVTIINDGTGNVSIAPGSGSLLWANGSGTYGTGNRTLAVAGVCTMWRLSTNWYIWGTGLT